MSGTRPDSARACRENGVLTDIVLVRNGKSLPMLGPAGPERELRFLPAPDLFPGGSPPIPGQDASQHILPVLIGSGCGAALAKVAAMLEAAYGPAFQLLVVDKEEDILEAGGLPEQYAAHPGVTWLRCRGIDETVKELTRLQHEAGGVPFFALQNPFYLRLDREYYSSVYKVCAASAKADFWAQARYAKFSGDMPRILLLTSSYFLIGEISSACERLGIPHFLLQLPGEEVGRTEFIETLLSAVLEFKPDFVFTINHLGVDREGVLTDLLERLRLPLASWFVDNPHLILHLYSRLLSPYTAIFTWDADNLESLQALGFPHVFYLPLGVDATRFHPLKGNEKSSLPDLPAAWDGRLSFVGNSMVHKVFGRKGRSDLPQALLSSYREVAAGFADSPERSVRAYLAAEHPELLAAFDALPDRESALGYETMLTWEATRQYRLSCVRGIMPFTPLIVGDDGWKSLLADAETWHYHSELNYYADLPVLYPLAEINFNCTSKQMKGAVNQRVFDVPATESFLLTDYREQMEALFEPGKEIVCYHCPEEATSLAREFLARPRRRLAIARAARRRILREHTYECRVRTLVERMRFTFG